MNRASRPSIGTHIQLEACTGEEMDKLRPSIWATQSLSEKYRKPVVVRSSQIQLPKPIIIYSEADDLDSSDSSPEAEAPPSATSSTSQSKAAPALGKGRACVKCRTRKMRCDGKRPACSSCIRSRRDCVYEEEKTRTKRLLDRIEELESKLQGLELQLKPSIDPKSRYNGTAKSRVSFKNATPADHEPSKPRKRGAAMMEDMGPPIAAPSPPNALDFTSDWWKLDPPPPDYQEYLIDKVLALKALPAFHVHSERFKASLLNPPDGQPPLPALQNAVFLIGCHYSENFLINQHEDHFLKRARTLVASTLQDQPLLQSNIIPWLQAGALVAYYFCRVGRWLETHHEVAGLTNLAMGCNLHKIKSSIWLPSDAFHVEPDKTEEMKAGVFSRPTLPPPADAIELFERIGIFWQLWMLDHSAALVTGLPHSIPEQEIETTWPRPFEDIDTDIDQAGDGSVSSLYGPNPAPPYDPPCSMHALRMKVVALVARMGTFQSSSNPVFRSRPEFVQEFAMYDHSIALFTERLPPVQYAPVDKEVVALPPPPLNVSLLLIHTFAHVAAIHLYGSLDFGYGQNEDIYQKRLTCARRACLLIRALNAAGISPTKMPIMLGFAWCAVVLVLGKHYRRLEQMTSDDDVLRQMMDTLDDFEVVFGAVQSMSALFPLLGYQLEKQRSDCFDVPYF